MRLPGFGLGVDVVGVCAAMVLSVVVSTPE